MFMLISLFHAYNSCKYTDCFNARRFRVHFPLGVGMDYVTGWDLPNDI